MILGHVSVSMGKGCRSSAHCWNAWYALCWTTSTLLPLPLGWTSSPAGYGPATACVGPAQGKQLKRQLERAFGIWVGECFELAPSPVRINRVKRHQHGQDPAPSAASTRHRRLQGVVPPSHTLVVLEQRPVADDEAPGAVVVLEQHPLGRVVSTPSERRGDGELPDSFQPPWLLDLQQIRKGLTPSKQHTDENLWT